MTSRASGRAGWPPLLFVVLAVCLIFAIPAQAQYMYLDTNGDGVHTRADVVHPTGTTKIAVWLITDRNRSGALTRCAHEANLTEYTLLLGATNGAVRWGRFAPDDSIGTDYEAEAPDSSYCAAWYVLAKPVRPGKHRLGTVTLTVLHGTPSVRIVPLDPERVRHIGTYFMSDCHSPQRERLLDQDWRDVDGLAYGGVGNHPPVLSSRSSFPVRAGSAAVYRIEARDRDGDPVTFRTVPREGVEPPPWIRVRTVAAGHGRAIGEVRVAADSCVENTWLFNLEASDGIWSDRKEAEAPIERIERPVPANPMGPPRHVAAQPPSFAPEDWPAGEWEWVDSPPGMIYPWFGLFRPSSGPVQAGTRRRMILRRDGAYEIYALNSGKVRRAEEGTYALHPEERGGSIQFSKGQKYVIYRAGSDTLCLALFGANDAGSDRYVRVASLTHPGGAVDTLRLLEPLGHPEIREDGSIALSAGMREALRRYDPTFQPCTVRDWPGPSNYEYSAAQIPWAAVGDFDGDLIPDAALFGRSGGDEVVVAVLSGHGNVRVEEVARRGSAGGSNHPSLELIPRGTAYSACWARHGTPETDAIGIVSPGVARFDYAMSNGQFVLYAPVP